MRRRWRATAMGSRRSARRCTSRRCTRGMVVGGSAACVETMATTFVAAQIGDGSGLPMAMTFVAARGRCCPGVGGNGVGEQN
jgi:hypothetical protein